MTHSFEGFAANSRVELIVPASHYVDTLERDSADPAGAVPAFQCQLR
jgi:hypothetical protein